MRAESKIKIKKTLRRGMSVLGMGTVQGSFKLNEKQIATIRTEGCLEFMFACMLSSLHINLWVPSI